MDPLLSILLFGAAYHPSPVDDGGDRYHNWTPGLGIMAHIDHAQACVGYYRNSIDRDTWFGAVGLDWQASRRFGVTVNAAAMSGYEPAPILLPMVTAYVQGGPVRIHAVAMPEAVGFFMEWRL